VALAVVLVLLGLAGCGAGRSTGVPGGPTEGELTQARQALARWAEAVRAAGGSQFSPVGDLTGQLGTWEPAVGDNAKRALLAGRVTAEVVLPGAPPDGGVVTWPGGTRTAVTVMSAAQALQALDAAGDPGSCGGCSALKVTGAHLGTGQVQTVRGPARAPVWEFSLAGTSVLISRVAVAADRTVTVTPPPWNANDPPAGLSIDDATVSADGMTLTAGLVGAPGPASQPCGVDYTGQAVESDTAVVVIITAHPHQGDDACAAIGARRTAAVRLSHALGDRAVLEVRQGLPVPIHS
jgi:hypothetical protein